ncbi:Fe-S cluster assembly protein SufB [Candidatus Woesearchaeota archaeon]|nr:Fe-S cluster assembly protein SufB [Candidatus Woesearchaeota archaeon]
MDPDNIIQATISKEDLDTPNEERYKFKASLGLTREIVETISRMKNEPDWMLQKRLHSFDVFMQKDIPKWGVDLSPLDLKQIIYYMRPDAERTQKWENLPEDIKKTFERLGIPAAERTVLGGAGAQYESDVVYHSLKKEWEDKGVIFEDCDVAVKKYPEIAKKYFMTKCVPAENHKFAALHGAVWSGGTFIYVPEGVKVTMPLQAYFRMNAKNMGQFEHTLIIVEKNAEVQYIEGCSAPQYSVNSLHAGCVEIFVGEGARVRYSSVENWSRNTWNLNTKRAIVEKNATMEWIGGNMGSGVTMLYPCSMLVGKNARADHISIAYAGKGQNQDTGAKVFHMAPNTTSIIKSKSISNEGGIASYRGMLKIIKGAVNSKSMVNCDALIMDDISKSNTFPFMDVKENAVDIGHEATVGKISDDQLFYLMSRGLSTEQATQMIVSGFIEPIVKELPLEYAVELNRLIQLQMEGSVG